MDETVNQVTGLGGSNKKVMPVQGDEEQGPKPVSYWQLPESIRQEMPVPKISVLVFADRTEDRFILMNGKRLGQGDEVMTGMKLEEVRRDGAVFSYRHYHFLVTR